MIKTHYCVKANAPLYYMYEGMDALVSFILRHREKLGSIFQESTNFVKGVLNAVESLEGNSCILFPESKSPMRVTLSAEVKDLLPLDLPTGLRVRKSDFQDLRDAVSVAAKAYIKQEEPQWVSGDETAEPPPKRICAVIRSRFGTGLVSTQQPHDLGRQTCRRCAASLALCTPGWASPNTAPSSSAATATTIVALCPEIAAVLCPRTQALSAALSEAVQAESGDWISEAISAEVQAQNEAQISAAFGAAPDIPMEDVLMPDTETQVNAATNSQVDKTAASQENSGFHQVVEAEVSEVDGFCVISLSSV